MKKETLIIIILTICLICTSGFIVYDNFIKEDSTIKEETNNEKPTTNEQLSSDIVTRVSDLSNIEKFLEHVEWDERNTNILESSNNRLEYITYTLDEDEDYIIPETDEQISIKTSFEKFQAKYTEAYGNLYSLNNDLNNEPKSILVNYCEESKTEICWNFANISGTTVEMTIKDKILNDDIYTLSGSYKITSYGAETPEEEGTFEIKYLIINEKEQLQSIILKNN